MNGNLYEILYQLSYNMTLVDYVVWVFAKNGKVVMYGKPNEIYHVIGLYFKLVNVNDYIIDEDIHHINLYTDLKIRNIGSF